MVQNVEGVDAKFEINPFRVDGEVLADSEIEVEVAGTTQIIARADLKSDGSPVLVEGLLRILEGNNLTALSVHMGAHGALAADQNCRIFARVAHEEGE